MSLVARALNRSNWIYTSPEEAKQTPTILTRGAPLKIQCMDWYSRNELVDADSDDEDSGSDEGSDESSNKKSGKQMEYFIYMFGITERGETVTVRFTDYCPYFYVRIPSGMTKKTWDQVLKDFLPKNGLRDRDQAALLDSSFFQKKDFWGFHNEELFTYARLVFQNTYAMKAYEKAFRKPVFLPAHLNCGRRGAVQFQLYESNIDPMIRFFHWRDIQPCGWVEVHDYQWNRRRVYSETQWELETTWQNVDSRPEDRLARMIEASFDLECYSSEGSFPLAKKDWSVLVSPILEDELYLEEDGINEYIRERIRNRKLLLKDPRRTAELSDDIQARAAHLFEGIADCIIRRKSMDSKEKRVLDEEMDRIKAELVELLNTNLPPLEGDPITQIGTTCQIYGLEEPREIKHIITLRTATIPDNKGDILVESYETEEEVLLAWSRQMRTLDPDILTGYNIFGFDMKYIYDRCEELGIRETVLYLSRMSGHQCQYKEQDLSSSAMGKNILQYIEIPGRVTFDLMKYFRRNHPLDSYKLDSVANTFMRDKVKKTEVVESTENTTSNSTNRLWITSELSEGIQVGNYVSILKNNSVYEDRYKGGQKIRILEVDRSNKRFLIEEAFPVEAGWEYYWCEAKDDIDHHQIFAFQNGTDEERGTIAKYCIQDCKLCNRLIRKLDIVINSIAMANVCSVPLSFIYNRGQGVKLFSLVAKACRTRDYCIPVVKYEQPKEGEDDSYEGAFVLDPKRGIYFDDQPIAVGDFNSLYPSCMISENLCHSTICLDPKYQGEEGAERLRELGHTYKDVVYDLYEDTSDKKGKEKDVKTVIGQQVCRYVQPKPDAKGIPVRGILPSILETLLKCRKDTRKRQATVEKSDLRWKVLEGQQLAFKVTANSLYGVTGASTSPLCLKMIAASTTATGRKNIMFAKGFVEREYGATVVYGDTDSIFIRFPVGERRGQEAIHYSMELCEEACGRISAQLDRPHNLEFEKVICPMILCAKKKYVGFFHTDRSGKYSIKYMGIVLKRRDNAPIVKHVFGEAIQILLKAGDFEAALRFVRDACVRILEGGYGIDKFVMSKTLKDFYKNPEGIAHKVLADRIGERTPGNKPQINDRIPFAYIEQDFPLKSRAKRMIKVLQGDKIEHPDYIQEKHLDIDYLHYISNQIMNPVCQVFDLVLGDGETERVLFEALIREENIRRERKALRKEGVQSITDFFQVDSSTKKVVVDKTISIPAKPKQSVKGPQRNTLLTMFKK